MDELYCKLCAIDTNIRRDDRTLSQKLDEDGVSEEVPVETVITDATRGFYCEDCGGLSGYAVAIAEDGEPRAVAISEHPADRFSEV